MATMNMIAAKRSLDGYTARLTMMQKSLTSLKRVEHEDVQPDGFECPRLRVTREQAQKVFTDALQAMIVVDVEMQSQARKLAVRPDELADLLRSRTALLDATIENLALRNLLDGEERIKNEPEDDPLAAAIAFFERGLDDD